MTAKAKNQANRSAVPLSASTLSDAPVDIRVLELFSEHRLSPGQRRVAQYIIENVHESVFLTSGDLAERANVSQPTVIRFAFATGFAGYPAMQRALRAIVANSGRPSGPADRHNKYQSVIASEEKSLARLRERLVQDEEVCGVGRRLADSNSVVVLGLRHSVALASHFAYFASKIHPSVVLVTRAGSVGLEQLLWASRDLPATIMCFALPRYPAELVQLLKYGREKGMGICTISDSPVFPFNDLSDQVLFAAVSTELVFDCWAGPAVLSSILLDAMANAVPARTQSRLEEFDKMVADAEFFVAN